MHEAIHCVLTKKRGKTISTGMINRNNEEEIGRCLNEGLTDWIIEQTGIKEVCYLDEKNIIKQLEIKLGKDAIMKFAKGDFKKVIPRALKMKKEECKVFIKNTDMLGNIKEIHKMQKSIVETLKRSKLDTKQLDELVKSEYYLKEIDGPIYMKYLKNNNKSTDIDTQISYFSKRENESFIDKYKVKYQIEQDIYDKYYKDELYTLRNLTNLESKIAKNYITKYDKYFKLVFGESMHTFTSEKFSDQVYSAELMRSKMDPMGKDIIEKRLQMLNTYQYVRKDLCQSIINETMKKMSQHSITGKEFDENLSVCSNPKQLEVIAKQLLQYDSKNVDNMCILLQKKNPSEIIKNGEFVALQLDEKKQSIYVSNNSKQIPLRQADEEKTQWINFTTPMGCSYNKTIENFSKFIQKVEKKFPNAKVQILDDVIILKDNGKNEFFVFEGEEIKKAEVIESEKINVKFKEERALTIVEQEKYSFLKRMPKFIKGKNSNKKAEEFNAKAEKFNAKAEKFNAEAEKEKNISLQTTRESFKISLNPDQYHTEPKDFNKNDYNKNTEQNEKNEYIEERE